MNAVWTKVGQWGNSEAVRIPSALLRKAGMAKGSGVCVLCRDDGVIEISLTDSEHRRVRRAEGITFESLTDGWDGRAPSDQWPSDDMIGAEAEAWQG